MCDLVYLCISLGSHVWQKTSLPDLDRTLPDLDCLVCLDQKKLWQFFRRKIHLRAGTGGL